MDSGIDAKWVQDFDCSKCGKEKGCFFPREASEGSCTGMGFAYQYQTSETMLMELMTDGSYGYIAVGFNTKNKMVHFHNFLIKDQLTYVFLGFIL